MTTINLDRVSKSYGPTPVVSDVSLEIRGGELFFLLGPSGCGKTTLLRSIAGFVCPDQGTISFDGRPMNDVPPRERGTGMVFQNYALWPHMTAEQNIAFGLEVRKISRPERVQRVAEAVALVRLQGLERNRPTQLSGGQQQRVSLARALVIRPNVLLLDEPLSNLDARLRAEMRDEIRRIHAETKVTTIYVTHDQKEALSLADRIAVMHAGRVVQVGSPYELYHRPCSRFVASFLGDANLVPARLRERNGEHVVVETPLGIIRSVGVSEHLAIGASVLCCIRPESILLDAPGPAGPNRFRSRVHREVFLGEVCQVTLVSGGLELSCLRLHPASTGATPDREMECVIPEESVVVLESN